MPNIGAPELIIILVIALIVLGPGRLPDVAQSLGKSVREFRKAATDLSDATNLSTPTNPSATTAASSGAAAPGAVQPNALSGEAAPNTLQGSSASPVSTDGETTPPAA
ncbi:MAG TPA: twin-arginine translocase TatA/TatE family subunit [Candidatus Limnocylindrales bacterium]